MGINKLFVKMMVMTVILLGANPIQAQLFSAGIKGGLTTSDLFTDKPSLGLTVGLMGELKIVDWLRLRTEANVMWKGTDKHFWEKDDVDYFSVGVPLIIAFMPFKNFYIGAGAELDYLFSAQEAAMPANHFNFGVLGHVEYRFFDRVGVGVRYVQNLGNFSQFEQLGEAVSSGSTANSAAFPTYSLQMTLSYRFGK